MKIYLVKHIVAELENKEPGREGFPTPAGFTLSTEFSLNFAPQIGMEIEVGHITESIKRIRVIAPRNLMFCYAEEENISAEYSVNYVPTGMPKKDLEKAKRKYKKLGWSIT